MVKGYVSCFYHNKIFLIKSSILRWDSYIFTDKGVYVKIKFKKMMIAPVWKSFHGSSSLSILPFLLFCTFRSHGGNYFLLFLISRFFNLSCRSFVATKLWILPSLSYLKFSAEWVSCFLGKLYQIYYLAI